MSGPKVYSFSGGSNSTENAMILSALSNGFFSGVSARVVNGNIEVTVQEYTSVFYSDLHKKIQEGKERYNRDIVILNKERNLDIQNIDNKIKSLDPIVNNYKKSIAENKQRLSILKQQYSMTFTTKYSTYNLNDVLEKVTKESNKLDVLICEVDNQKNSIIRTLDNYKSSIKRCQTLDDYYDRQIDVNHYSISVDIDNSVYDNLKKELDFKAKQLQKFTNFVNTISKEFINDELRDYEDRIKNLILKLDPMSNESMAEISNALKQIKTEISNIKSLERMNVQNTSLRNLVSELNKYIDELLVDVSPMTKEAKVLSEISVDVSKKSEEVYKEYNNIIKSIDELQFISNPNKTTIDSIKSLFNRNKSFASKEVLDRLSRSLNDLKALYQRCIKDNENYALFEKARQRYSELFNGIVAITTKNPEILIKDLKEPTQYIFRCNNAQAQLEEINKLNNSIDSVLRSIKETSMMQGLSHVAHHNEVFTDSRRKGIKNLTYVRKTDKGILFDVKAENGDVMVYPRAVVLSNGKKTMTKDELNNYYNSCNWADEVDEGFKSVGLGQIKYSEMAEEREKMLDEMEYYHCKTEEESIRFLKMSGYSDLEIEELGYSVSKEDDHEEEEDERRESASIGRARSL